MFQLKPDNPKCARCGSEIAPGLMNLAYHYLECKSPVTNAKKMRAETLSKLVFGQEKKC
jgi:hypothetical protein